LATLLALKERQPHGFCKGHSAASRRYCFS
jgi:hypothetical protein